MSLHQLGEEREAHTVLALGRESINGKFESGLDVGSTPQGFWCDWVFGQIVLTEASRLMGGPAISPQPIEVTR